MDVVHACDVSVLFVPLEPPDPARGEGAHMFAFRVGRTQYGLAGAAATDLPRVRFDVKVYMPCRLFPSRSWPVAARFDEIEGSRRQATSAYVFVHDHR